MAHVAQSTAWPGCKRRAGHVVPATRQPCRRSWASQIDLDTHGYVHSHGALLRHALLGPLVMSRRKFFRDIGQKWHAAEIPFAIDKYKGQ